jgi:hypothetical protein
VTLRTGPNHKDVKKRTWYGRVTPAHHTITWTSSHDGTTLLVKIFDKDHIEMSFNGTFALTLDEMSKIRDECVRYLYGGWEAVTSPEAAPPSEDTVAG